MRGLNETIQHLHAKRMTTRQIVMFTLADMMTVCEVADAFCRRARALEEIDGADAAAFAAMSRLQAQSVLAVVGRGVLACAAGPADAGDAEAMSEIRTFLAGLATADLLPAYAGRLADVASVTEHIKRQVP